MDMTTVERFWASLISNPGNGDKFRQAFPKRPASQPTPQALAAFARTIGFELNADDFLHHRRSHTIRIAAPDGELSDEVLDAVAGGGSADSQAPTPLEIDIYASWDQMDSMLGADPFGARADKPKKRPSS